MFQGERPHLVRRGADKGNPSIITGLGELRRLAEQVIAWMNPISTALASDAQNGRLLKVTLGNRRRANTVGLVCITHMQ